MKVYERLVHFDELVNRGVNNAVFDVDNTITKSNIAQFYFFIKSKRLNRSLFWWPFLLYCAVAAPFYLLLDFISRDWFNHLFVQRKFRKYTYEELENYAEMFFNERLKQQFISPIHDLIYYLKEKGVQITLLSCLPVIKTDNGVRIDFSNLEGFKYRSMQQFEPALTIAVGDSKYDLPMLEHVHYSIIVTNKKKKWMKSIQREALLIRN